MKINIDVARKVLQTIDAGLCMGVGNPVPGQMCVEAAVCYALGRPHGDKPTCVAPSLRSIGIRLNDAHWSSNKARADGLRRFGLAQLGSAGALDEAEFARRVVDLAIRRAIPVALRAAASVHPQPTHREALLAAADQCEQAGSRAAVMAARAAYGAAADDADAAADAAACAAYAAAYAAEAAARAAYAAYAAYAAARAAYAGRKNEVIDETLAAFAEGVVQILMDMGAPGCRWLELT